MDYTVLIITVLNLIEALLPSIGVNNQTIDKIIDALIRIVPIISEKAKQFLPNVLALIDSIKSTGALSESQMATFDALRAAADQDFDGNAAEYLKNHPDVPGLADAVAGLAPAAVQAPADTQSSSAPSTDTSGTAAG